MSADGTDNHFPSSQPPPVIEGAPWGVGWAAMAYMGFMAIQVVPSLIALLAYCIYCVVYDLPFPQDPADYPVMILGGAAICSHLLIVLWVFILVRMVHGLNFRRGISWDGKREFPAWKAAAAGFGLVIFNVIVLSFFPPLDDMKVPLKEFTESSEGFIIFGFMAVFLSPISEELLFRGYIFAPLERRTGPAAAVFITALLFMAPHLPQLGEFWQGAALICLLGFVTGFLRACTGGLWASCLCHLVYNALLLFFEALGRFMPAP